MTSLNEIGKGDYFTENPFKVTLH